MMSEQLVFDLPHRPAMGADDFFVSSCNEAAVHLIDTWPDWTHRIQMIEGPAGSGKSHLANVWRLRTGAQSIDSAAFKAADIAELSLSNGLILEDLDSNEFDEQSVFHLLNLSRERDFCMLLTARSRPARWAVQLPDLISRLRTMPVTTIGAPDDALLGAVLLKHFSDRQLNVEPQVLKFLVRRIRRSMDATHEVVVELDREALSSGRKITRNLASKILEKLHKT